MAGARHSELLAGSGVQSVNELAETGGVPSCLKWITRQRRWVDEKHLEICRIPAPTFQEERRAEWMVGQFRKLGLRAETDPAGNVIARFPQADGDASIAMTAHLDTVLAPRRPDDVRVGGDGLFYGPGVSDNGAGLAALLALAAAFTEGSLVDGGPPVLFIANVGEEGEGNLSGMRYLCRPSGLAEQARAFLVVDGPSTGHITCRAVASRRFEVALAGPGGHSWSDYGTGNPVHALSHAIFLFTETQANGASRFQQDRTSFNFGTFEGGPSVNSIPTEARSKVDLRSEDPARIEELSSILTGSVEKAIEAENSRATGGKLSAKIKEIGSRPGGTLDKESLLLRSIQAVDSHLGIRAKLDSASTDANIPLSQGLEAVSIGAGGEGGGAHTPAEWYDPKGREIGLKRILLTLALLVRALHPVGSVAGR
ncbi:MAG: M20/M25/M40 family metallo-hydrolase [bacterium]|nr:M20/M25/M40 family metallo-hydrolase [bacterium]